MTKGHDEDSAGREKRGYDWHCNTPFMLVQVHPHRREHDEAEFVLALGVPLRSPSHNFERVKGIEPSYEAWEAAVLPLNYTRNTVAIMTVPPGADDTGKSRPAIRSFVVRNGRMGPGQARALAQLGPDFVLRYQDCITDFGVAFGRSAPLVIEIGFGMGGATAAIAQALPGTNFLGIEVHPPGVGALLKLIGELGLTNLRLVQHDAVAVLERMIAPASLAGAHIFFPDPWHKARHHKRRLLQPPFVRLLASRLTASGRIHCATDWEPYAMQMLDVLAAEPALRNTTEGFAERPAHRPLTKFENRGLGLGHGVWDLVFEKR